MPLCRPNIKEDHRHGWVYEKGVYGCQNRHTRSTKQLTKETTRLLYLVQVDGVYELMQGILTIVFIWTVELYSLMKHTMFVNICFDAIVFAGFIRLRWRERKQQSTSANQRSFKVDASSGPTRHALVWTGIPTNIFACPIRGFVENNRLLNEKSAPQAIHINIIKMFINYSLEMR